MNETKFFSVMEDKNESRRESLKEKSQNHSITNRQIDRVFAQYGGEDTPSPIKPPRSKSNIENTENEATLNLRLDSSTSRITSVQPESMSSIASVPSMILTEMSDVNENNEINKPLVEIEKKEQEHLPFTRKRSQDQREPELEFPRASKQSHKETAPPLPEFKEAAVPDIHFSTEDENVFKPKLYLNDQTMIISRAEETSCPEGDHEGQPEDRGSAEPSDEKELTSPPGTDNKKIPKSRSKKFDANKTLDMTLRTSGGVSFITGFLMAIDESLDPVLSFLVPHGLRKNGTNLIIIALSLLVAILVYFLL